MDRSTSSMAQQIAQAASAFEVQQSGHPMVQVFLLAQSVAPEARDAWSSSETGKS